MKDITSDYKLKSIGYIDENHKVIITNTGCEMDISKRNIKIIDREWIIPFYNDCTVEGWKIQDGKIIKEGKILIQESKKKGKFTIKDNIFSGQMIIDEENDHLQIINKGEEK
jgi:hypothetical protein